MKPSQNVKLLMHSLETRDGKIKHFSELFRITIFHFALTPGTTTVEHTGGTFHAKPPFNAAPNRSAMRVDHSPQRMRGFMWKCDFSQHGSSTNTKSKVDEGERRGKQ